MRRNTASAYCALSRFDRLRTGIDAQRQQVHIRDAKGNKDRLVPLPATTFAVLRRFWQGVGQFRASKLPLPN